MNDARSLIARQMGLLAFAFGALTALGTTQARASQEREAISVSGDVTDAEAVSTRSPHKFQVAAGIHHFDYQEEVPAPRKSQESGMLPSAMVGYRYDTGASEPLFLARLEGSLAVSTQYQGTDQSGRRAISGTTPSQFLELEAELASPAWAVRPALQARAYAGAGYHYWRRGDQATSDGAYREDYQWPLAIAGALIESHPVSRLGIDLDLSARWQALGTMKVFLSEIDGDLQDVTVHLGNRLGFKAQLPVNYQLYRQMSLLVSPWIEYSSIGQSDPVAIKSADGATTGMALSEPSSRTIQYGSLVGVSFGL
jgi:hypothetical protein